MSLGFSYRQVRCKGDPDASDNDDYHIDISVDASDIGLALSGIGGFGGCLDRLARNGGIITWGYLCLGRQGSVCKWASYASVLVTRI